MLRRAHSAIALSACLAAVALTTGCKTLYKRPVAENVIEARQTSLRGMEAMEAGRLDEAEQLLAKAIQICPVDERARCRYADLLWKRGRFDAAVAQMEEAIRYSAGDATLLVQLGRMRFSRGDAKTALADAERATQADPHSAAAWALHGDALAASGRLTDALASYHRVLAIDDHQPQVRLAIAKVYMNMRQPARSLATLRALEDRFGPHDAPPEVLIGQGIALKQLGRFGDAADVLASAIERGDTSAATYFELADAQAQAGDVVNARLSLSAALAQSPAHAPSLKLMNALRPSDLPRTAGRM
jgi:tetratricopeptide (TPR) repeat protein